MSRPRRLDRESIRAERLSLSLTPKNYDAVVTLAQIKGTSINELITGMIDQLVAQNAAIIEEFTATQSNFADRLNLSVATE